MRSGFRKKWDKLNLKLESEFRKHKYRKNVKIRLKRMNGGFDCEKEYQEKVIPYWEKFGYKPAKIWYQVFADKDHKVDPRYIPDDLYYGELVPYFSNSQFRRFGEDKCYHDVWFTDIERPETICKNIAGIYYDSHMNIISFEEAVRLCMEYKQEFLLKPSIDSGEGRLISFYTPGKFNKNDIMKKFDTMGANYIVQAAVKQHSILAQLNPTSLNTIRVVSFLFEGKVHILSAILRVGAPKSRVDNVGAGGFAIPILDTGQLNKCGVNRKAEWKTVNQKGIPFSNIVIPNYDKLLQIIKKKHKILAHFKLIGWDFALNEEGNFVFIEFNVCPGANQITCGPTFGDLTDKVLEEFFVKRTLDKAQN